MQPSATSPTRRRIAGLLVGVLAAATGGIAVATMPANAAPDTNVVLNGDLESGSTDPWAERADATIALTDDAAGGDHALHVTNRTASQAGPVQSIRERLEPNTTYTVTAKVKYETGPATKQFYLTSVADDTTYTNLAGAQLSRGQWGTFTSIFTTGSTLPSTYDIFFETVWASATDIAANPAEHLMDFTVDDVSIVEASATSFGAVGKLPGNGNPLVSNRFGADPFALEHDGRVYLYMTDDTQEWAPDANNISTTNSYAKITQINVISSEDLVNWTDHGAIPVAGPDGVATWADNAWAPGVASKVVDGQEKFFLYFANNGTSTGVLVGDSPTGPWTDPIGKPLIDAATPGAAADGNWLFDPAPFVDTDGQAYLYFGGGVGTDPNNPRTTRWISLGDDMVSTVGSAQVIDAPKVFEAGHVFERDGIYYYSYSTNFVDEPRPENYPTTGAIAYLMSSSPEGPWTPAQLPALNQGVVFENPSTSFGVGSNNHQSFFELNGTYYLAYHAQTLNLALVGGVTADVRGFRNTHLNEVTFNADGTMNLVQGTYSGVAQVRSFDSTGPIEAETIAWQKGVTTSRISEPSATGDAVNSALEQVEAGDWVALAGVDFGADAATSLSARVRSLTPGGSVEVYLDSPDDAGQHVGTLAIDSATDEWATVTTEIESVTGEHDVYFVFTGPAGAELALVDFWEFHRGAAAPTLDVTVVAGVRCAAGKALPTITVTNDDGVPLAVTATSAYSTKTFPTIAPGANGFHAFTTRLASIPAGTIAVEASAIIDGQAVSTTQDVGFDAVSCS